MPSIARVSGYMIFVIALMLMVRWSLARTLYPAHRYGLPLEGAPESVSALGAEDARAFHRRIFTPDNAIFYATGDLDEGQREWYARSADGSLGVALTHAERVPLAV